MGIKDSSDRRFSLTYSHQLTFHYITCIISHCVSEAKRLTVMYISGIQLHSSYIPKKHKNAVIYPSEALVEWRPVTYQKHLQGN